MTCRYSFRGFVAATLLTLASVASWSQGYPDRPMRLVIPFGPGSGTDSIGRAVGRALSEETGQSVVIENKPGAEGFIGVQAVQHAAPDGYTILLSGSSTQVLNMHLFKKVPYDPIKDFVPVTSIARTGMLFNVNAKSPYMNIQDFIEAARKKPGTLSFGSGSATTRLAGEFFAQQAGVKLLHVPYRTPALAITDLMGDQLSMVFVDLPGAGPHIKSGRLRALAVSGSKRMAAVPEIPTLRELGLKDFDLTAWYGIWLPAGTPQPVVMKLHALLDKVMKTAQVQSFFTTASMDTFTMTPDEFMAFHLQELAKVGKVVKDAGVEAQ